MLATWRPTNAARGLSGVLLYSGGNIIQTLEGPEDAVDGLFDTISRDPRHTGILTLLREPLDARVFADWSMGFRELSHEDVQDVEGFNPFLQRSVVGDLETSSSSALHLLGVFKQHMR